MGIVARKKARGRRGGALYGRAVYSVRMLSFAALAILVVGAALWLLLRKSGGVMSALPESTPPKEPVSLIDAARVPSAAHSAGEIPTPRVAPPSVPTAKAVTRGAADAVVPAHTSEASATAAAADESPAESPPGDPDNPDLAVGFGQALSMLHSVELGDDPPPFPQFYAEDEDGNEDFFLSETNVIVIGENDTPAQERRKEAIAWAKVDIGEYVRAGGRAKDALSDIYAYQKECAKLRIDASDDFRAWLTEHPEEADEVLAALADFNTSLRKEGIKELSEEEIQPFNEKWEER